MKHTLFIDLLNVYRILRTRETVVFMDEVEVLTLQLLDGKTVHKFGLKLKPMGNRRFRVFDLSK